MKVSLTVRLLCSFRFLFISSLKKRNCNIVLRTTAHKWCYRMFGFMCVCPSICGCWLLTCSSSTNISWWFYPVYISHETFVFLRHTTTFCFLKNSNIYFHWSFLYLKRYCMQCIEGLTNFYCYMLHKSSRVFVLTVIEFITLFIRIEWNELSCKLRSHSEQTNERRKNSRQYKRVKMDWSLGRMIHVTHKKFTLYRCEYSMFNVNIYTAIKFYIR